MADNAWSLFVSNKQAVTEHQITSETRVGRGPECQVKIRHPTCSKHHFTVRALADGVELEHAHPVNENPRGKWATIRTFVNGVQIPASTKLAPGDVITLKPDPGPDGITIEVKPSQNPMASKPEDAAKSKPWWQFW